MSSLLGQRWDYYQPTLTNLSAPVWQLLYDEQASNIVLDESDEVTMVLRLSHADTARINAVPGSKAGKGTQYFWLSKDCYDFFPPLTIRNQRGYKVTYSCIVNMYYVELGVNDPACRVTFEAENNLDFRLGTGKLRYSRVAEEGDIAAISRVGETQYELRIFRRGTREYDTLMPFAVHFIGHQGKKYGYVSNAEFNRTLGIRVGANKASRLRN